MNKIEKLSPFKMGWLICMFDLPTVTRKERKAASTFRNELLDDGWIMLQFSVYARSGVSRERMEKHSKRVEEITPFTGYVRVFFLTDKQWVDSKSYVCDSYINKTQDADMPEQAEFW